MNKHLFTKKSQFSIRKLTVGVCSVIIGMSFLSGVEVKADTEGTSPAPTGQGATPTAETGVSTAEEANLVANSPAPEVTTIAVNNQSIALENEAIARHFEVQDGKLRTTSIENKLADGSDRLEFQEGSKEFVIRFKETDPSTRPTPPSYEPYAQDKASWTVTTNSAANAGAREGAVALAQDNNLGTIWHSNYNNGIGTPNTLPAHVEITLPTPRDLETFIYVPRQDGGQNGLIKDYKIYAKADGAVDYEEIKAGTITDNPSQIQFIDLGRRLTNVKTIKFEALSAQNGQPFAAAAEFDVSDRSATTLIAEQAQKVADYTARMEAHLDQYQISLDKLILAENGIQRERSNEGEKLTFTFKPHVYQNVPVTVKYVVDLAKDSKFSQAHLLLSVPEADRERLTIDTIDLQSFKIKATDRVHDFSNQAAIAEMAGFNGFYAGLGQPVYIKSFYTGSEFPVALNTVEAGKNQMISRYYSGKTLAQLGVDASGNTRTWNTVVGVARSDDYQVIQQDFYDYISKIGQDTYFRKQYNSWFDHMLNITADNIQSSFNEIERGFVNGGVSPLHSYVVDDGWQDMTTLWDFNQKFPNKLYDSSKQVKRFGSDFGLWVGPQGGYSEPGRLADNLVRQGKASKHAGVVYIGDKRYVEGMDNLFANYDKEFDINYWKLDGLLLNPRSDTDPNGNFIGGGHRNMYSMTEAHERWIGLYETIRRESTDPDKMWINLTSYIPPSPWFLQWVNSIWMQNAADVDYQDHVKKAQYAHLDFGNDAAEAITYRDDRYEELVNLRKWQLPFANIYNHDPVYGNTANSGKKLEPNAQGQRPKINFSAEDLRTYLFMLGTRGTGFWEFYYSYNMMDDEKWQVNGEVVNWIEANYETLKHAKFHGGKPGHGEVYGYSAWDEETGILSIRNPINSEQTYTITLDRLVGVREGMTGMHRTTVHGDKRHDSTALTNYGDQISLTLKPYETVIFQFSKTADTKAPEVLVAKAIADNIISIEFDERILPTGASFAVAGNTVTAVTYNKDLRTAVLTLGTPLNDRQVAEVTYTDVADNAPRPNKATGTLFVTAYNQGVIEDITAVDKATPLLKEGIEGRGPFSVTAKVTLNSLNQTIAEQDGQWRLSVDEAGRVIFDVKGLQVTSAPFSTLKAADRGTADVLIQPDQEAVITAVREKNGSLKLFIDGQLHNTAHDKTKVNDLLEKSTLRVASPDFDGSISRFILEDKARDFQSAPALFDQVSPRPHEVATELGAPTATSFDPNDGGERPAGSATDKNPTTYWASNPNKDNTVEPQRLTIELAEAQEVGRVLYTPRQIANAVGNVKKAFLEYSTDGQTFNRVTFTNGNADNTINMVDGIASTPMDFTPVTAKFFRFTALETHHWSPARVNKVVAVAELTPVVTVTPSTEVPVTLSYLRNTLYQAGEIARDEYRAAGLAAFDQAVRDAIAVYTAADNQEAIDAANTALKVAIAGLERKVVSQKERRVSVVIPIPVDTVRVNDDSLEQGRIIIEDGEAGEEIHVYLDTYVDDELTESGTEVVETIPVKPAKPKRERVGTNLVTPPADPTQPAVTPARILEDKATGIQVLLSEGEDANIVALRIVAKETGHVATPSVLKGADYDLFDIELVDKHGKIIKMAGRAEVSLPVDAGKEVATVVYLPNSDKADSLPFRTAEVTTVSGQTQKVVIFTAEHFSEYGIVYKPATVVSTPGTSTDIPVTQPTGSAPIAPTPAGSAPDASKLTLPNTGEASSSLALLDGAALVAALGLTSLRKRED
ncbi:discoidin domain-containing protein [Streptococcus sp. E17BB]|uniref:discoidin domain-containing protein n=1 Tax=Streptococcus sp. E17BB TaxID=3278714 RepID=UPI00359EE37A